MSCTFQYNLNCTINIFSYYRFSLDDVTSKSIDLHEYRPDLSRMKGASTQLIDFTRKLLSPKPEDRPSVVTALEHPWLKFMSKYEEKRSTIQYDLSPGKHEMESKDFTERFMHLLGVKYRFPSSKKSLYTTSSTIEDTEEIFLKSYTRRPQILSRLTDVFALPGSKVVLQCQYEVMNCTNYQVCWSCNNKNITERISNKYYVDTSITGYSMLEIRSIDEDTSGTYSVKVINEAGYAIDSCNVIVKCKQFINLHWV